MRISSRLLRFPSDGCCFNIYFIYTLYTCSCINSSRINNGKHEAIRQIRDRAERHPFTIMALPSGVYIIENVNNRNWAILKNDNEDEDVISGTDADENSGHKVINLLNLIDGILRELLRAQWDIRRLSNGTYLLRNQRFGTHATYKLTDVQTSYVTSIRTGTPRHWHINPSDGFYWCVTIQHFDCSSQLCSPGYPIWMILVVGPFRVIIRTHP
jgi:hypothetical protein